MKTLKNFALTFILFVGSFVILLYVGKDVQPTSSLFPIQRLDESLILISKRTPETKADYYQYLIQKRFSDIAYVVRANHTDILVSVSLRYSTTIGNAVQFAITNNVNKNQLKEELTNQKQQLQNIVLHYTSNDRRQIYIEDAINYINIYKEKL